jgi:hypothetical protein
VSQELQEAKRQRRRAERAIKKHKLTVFNQIYNAAKRAVTNIVHSAKISHYSAKIKECLTCKQLFRVTDHMLGNKMQSALPTIFPLVQLPQKFLTFFVEKIVTIRTNLDTFLTTQVPTHSDKKFNGRHFSDFESVDESTVKKMMLQIGAKACDLDPFPGNLFIECLDTLLPYVTKIMNDSLSTGMFPDSMKHALVRPLIKKPSLDRNDLKNYRPVSNLCFLSKVLEKLVLLQLNDHLLSHDLLQSHQSAYRSGHSTETALLKIINDLLIALDKRNIAFLTLLDLSAAFDTIDHSILLKRLENTFGITGSALSWFRSYLTNRTQSVVVNGLKSESSLLQFGVPQGSVLGPVLFVMYISPLFDVVKRYNISHHAFADDNQLYTDSLISNVDSTLCNIQDCVASVKTWMTINKLQLNDSKTEALLLRSPYTNYPDDLLPSCMHVGESEINFATSVTNLGVTLDHHINLSEHVRKVCQTAFHKIREISSIRECLTVDATKILMCSMVLSRIDYCNSLLYGCDKGLKERLQRVQNAASKVILRKKKTDHVSPLLRELHWLPVESRIKYKIACICYSAKFENGPSYLRDLIITYDNPSTYNLRSRMDNRTFEPPSTNLVTIGDRSFSAAAAAVWNSLPFSVRHSVSMESFKRSLKTYLFDQEY